MAKWLASSSGLSPPAAAGGDSLGGLVRQHDQHGGVSLRGGQKMRWYAERGIGVMVLAQHPYENVGFGLYLAHHRGQPERFSVNFQRDLDVFRARLRRQPFIADVVAFR